MPDIFVAALSTDRGELLGSPDWGSDLRRRFDELGDTKLFERLVALEAMQMASIPFEDHGGPSVTPLRCVERIESIKLRPGRTPDRRLASVVAEINGIGRWKADVEIWVAFPSQKSKPNPAMGSVVWTENYKGQRWSAVLSGRDDAVWILRVLNGNTTQGDIYWDPDASAVASRTGALDREIVEKIVASLRRLTAGA